MLIVSYVNPVKTGLIIGDLGTTWVRKVQGSVFKAVLREPSGQIQKVFKQVVALFGTNGFRMELNTNGWMLCVA